MYNACTAVFVFSFTILVPASFVVAFNDTQGFREIAVLDTTYVVQAKYDIDEVQKANTTVLVSSLEDALSQVNQSASHKNLTLATYDEPVAFAEKLLDVCKAADVTCDWGYKCVANRCLFKCEGFDCGDHLCHVPQTGQEDEKDEPQCKCVPDDMYNYDGEKCDEASLREKWVVVIAGSVGGFLLLVVVVLVACFCCHRRRLKQQDKPYLDAYEPSELNGYNDTQIAKKFRTSYDNEAYQADGLFPTPRGDVDLHRFYDSSPPDNGLPSEPTPMLSDFAEGPFVIRRPKLLVRPKTEM
nr:hypothetical protein BaRGS_000224 [Batillaria attramentaria]